MMITLKDINFAIVEVIYKNIEIVLLVKTTISKW